MARGQGRESGKNMAAAVAASGRRRENSPHLATGRLGRGRQAAAQRCPSTRRLAPRRSRRRQGPRSRPGTSGGGERGGHRGTRDVKGERSLPRPTPDATCKRQAVRAAGGGIAETAVAVKRRLTAAWSTHGGERCAPQRQISQETRGPA